MCGLVPVGAAGFPSIYARVPWVLNFRPLWDTSSTGQHQMCRLLQVGAKSLLADHSGLPQLLWECVFPAAGWSCGAGERKQCELFELVPVGPHSILEPHSWLPWLLRARAQWTFPAAQWKRCWKLRGLVPVGPAKLMAVHPRMWWLLRTRSTGGTGQRPASEWNAGSLRQLVQMGPACILAVHSELPRLLRWIPRAAGQSSHSWTGLHHLVSVRADCIPAVHPRMPRMRSGQRTCHRASSRTSNPRRMC